MDLTKSDSRIYLNCFMLDEAGIEDLVLGATKCERGYSMPLDIMSLKGLNKVLTQKVPATDDLKEWYKREREKQDKATQVLLGNYTLDQKGLNTEMEEYQRQAVAYFQATKNCLVAYDAGLGKSLVAINCMKSIQANRILIVCPSYIKYSWSEELEKWSKYSYNIIDGERAVRELDLEEKKQIYIINYEMLTAKSHFSILYDRHWDLVIFDEAHRLKGRNSQITGGAKKLPKNRGVEKFKKVFGAENLNAKHKLMLTATPISKNETEIWKLLNILDPKRFTSYWAFAKYYNHVVEGFYGLEVHGLKRKKDYEIMLQRYMIRKIKEDVKDLPDKIIHVIPVIMGQKQLTAYKRAKKEFLNPDNSIIESQVERFIRLTQITQNPAILGGSNTSVVEDTAIDILADKQERVLVACTFIGMSELLHKAIDKKFKDRNVFLVNGGVNVKKRQEIIDKFRNDKSAIIVTTIKALAEGVNLDCCNTIVNCDYDWSNASNYQFMNRIHRMTSTQTKFYYHIIVKKSVHEYKYKKLYQQDKAVEEALNDTNRNMKMVVEEYMREGDS